jgi:hypothetical protein
MVKINLTRMTKDVAATFSPPKAEREFKQLIIHLSGDFKRRLKPAATMVFSN